MIPMTKKIDTKFFFINFAFLILNIQLKSVPFLKRNVWFTKVWYFPFLNRLISLIYVNKL